MTQHYTRNTVQVMAWCSTCGRNTMHAVHDRRLGSCLEPHRTGMSKKQERLQAELAKKEQQPELW